MKIGGKMKNKIISRQSKIGVIGLGYVGLPLAMEFANCGFNVIGFDTNSDKIKSLNNGKSHIDDIPDTMLKKNITEKNFFATTNFEEISKIDAVSICVPTPLNVSQEPDISNLLFSAKTVGLFMKKPLLITLESTTYPGCTREIFYDYFESINKRIDKDYFLCFSPERIDPGNSVFKTNNIPKVIGGISAESTKLGKLLYEAIINSIVPVSSLETAEMSKLLENTFRSVNIAFVNEMSLMCDRLGINIWEVIDAASTKPFGFLPFYPGSGVGGHCIPLDPMYLYWKGKQRNFFNKFIELSQSINMNMPYYVVDKIMDKLNTIGKSLKNSRILLVGISYKADIGDIRESPTLNIFEILKEKQADISLIDPHVNHFKDKKGNLVNVISNNKCNFQEYDCVVILTKHSSIEYKELKKDSNLIVDMCNTFV